MGTLKSREKKVMKETWGLRLSFCLQMGNGPALGRVVLVRMCSAAGNRLARLKQPSLTSQLMRQSRLPGLFGSPGRPRFWIDVTELSRPQFLDLAPRWPTPASLQKHWGGEGRGGTVPGAPPPRAASGGPTGQSCVTRLPKSQGSPGKGNGFTMTT